MPPSLFQLVVINFQLRAASTNNAANLPPEADLGAARAVADFVLFVPGVTAAVLVFLVFGTTRTFREYAWRRLVPAPLRSRWEAARATRAGRAGRSRSGTAGSVSVSAPGHPSAAAARTGVVDADGERSRGGGNGAVVLGLQSMGRRDADGTSDELPIWKPEPRPTRPGLEGRFRVG